MKSRGKFGEFEELGVRKSGAFFRGEEELEEKAELVGVRKSGAFFRGETSALSSKGKVILLIACLFLLLFPLASAKDFIKAPSFEKRGSLESENLILNVPHSTSCLSDASQNFASSCCPEDSCTRSFRTSPESDSADLYFVVNGTTGNVDVASTGFFGCNRNIFKFKILNSSTLSPQYDLSGNAGLPFFFGGCYCG